MKKDNANMPLWAIEFIMKAERLGRFMDSLQQLGFDIKPSIVGATEEDGEWWYLKHNDIGVLNISIVLNRKTERITRVAHNCSWVCPDETFQQFICKVKIFIRARLMEQLAKLDMVI